MKIKLKCNNVMSKDCLLIKKDKCSFRGGREKGAKREKETEGKRDREKNRKLAQIFTAYPFTHPGPLQGFIALLPNHGLGCIF